MTHRTFSRREFMSLAGAAAMLPLDQTPATTPANDASTLLTPKDFTFDGFYRIPGYLPYQMLTTYRRVGSERRLFGVSYTDFGGSQPNDFYLYEWRVPSAPPSPTLAEAPFLELVRQWGRLYRDHINSDANTGNDSLNPGSLWWDEARGGIWWTYTNSYVPLPNSPSLGFTALDEKAGTLRSYGPWRITDGPFFTTGTITALPAAWAKTHLSGQTVGFAGALGSGVAQAPMGTSLLCSSLLDPLTTPPQQVGTKTILGNPRYLLYHDIKHRQARDTSYRTCAWKKSNGGPSDCGLMNDEPVPLFAGNDPAANSSDNASRFIWIDNGVKRGVVYFGALVRFPTGHPGVAHMWYGAAGVSPGQNQSCCHGQFDPAWIGTTGPGAGFRSPTAWFYDPNEFVRLARGSANGWDVLPTVDADRWAERFPTAYPIRVATDAFTKTGVPSPSSMGMGAHVDSADKKLLLSFRLDGLQFAPTEVFALQQFSVAM